MSKLSIVVKRFLRAQISYQVIHGAEFALIIKKKMCVRVILIIAMVIQTLLQSQKLKSIVG